MVLCVRFISGSLWVIRASVGLSGIPGQPTTFLSQLNVIIKLQQYIIKVILKIKLYHIRRFLLTG